MTYQWDDAKNRLTDDQGRPALLPHLGSKLQFDRWTLAGYDFEQAMQRRSAFLERLSGRDNENPAAAMIAKHIADEMAIALQSGIVADDVDIWRIPASAKHIQF